MSKIDEYNIDTDADIEHEKNTNVNEFYSTEKYNIPVFIKDEIVISNTIIDDITFNDISFNIEKSDYSIKDSSFANEFIKYYFRRVSEKNKKISVNNKILSGQPVVKNTRIPITTILKYLKDQEDFDAIKEDFQIEILDIEKALDYTINILQEPYYED